MTLKQDAIAALRGLRFLCEVYAEAAAMKYNDAWYTARLWDPVLHEEILAGVTALDLYLTGKTECRNRDRDLRAIQEVLSGSPWLMYLSDGGYSRVGLDLATQRAETGLWLTNTSNQPVWDRWNAIVGRFPFPEPGMWPDPLRIILLDIDGVLHSVKTSPNGIKPVHPGRHIPPEQIVGVDRSHMERLNRVIEATGALVVISSSWRNSHGMDETRDTFKRAGFAGTILTGTPSMGHRRSGDIQTFFDDWGRDDRPRIASYVILDDEESMDHLTPRLIVTDAMQGLSDMDADKAISMLSEDRK
jgi:hypothetical protein